VIRVEFVGTPAHVQATIDDYMERYHPVGYGTQVVATTELPDGRVAVVVSRFDSCD